MEIIKFIGLVILGYILGSVSVARMITNHKNKGKDITTQGSGNPGTMNMLRTQGAILGFLTLFCYALKAEIPTLIGRFLLFPGSEKLALIAMYVGGLSAVLGHMFPLFYGFKGGKGIACTFGIFVVANPILALIIFVIDFVIFYFVKIGSVASMIFIISFALINTFISPVRTSYIAMIIMWFIVIIDVIAHKDNFIRLFANEERLTSFKEGVQKDLERVKEKKKEKLTKLENKEDELNILYEEKLAKSEEKINKKMTKKSLKMRKKREKLRKKYNNKINDIKTNSEETILYMQERIDKKKQKEEKAKDED